MNEYWRVTEWPTLEITTSIPKKGCVVDCVFCPQRVLQKVWDAEKFTSERARTMQLEDFKKVIDKLPKEVRITLSGFTEPWLNSKATDMLLYAHEQGHRVSVFTTAVGMKLKDVERLKDIPYCGGPNGGFTLHLPDKEYRAKHPVTSTYIKVVEALKNANINNFQTMAMGTVHPEVEHLYPDEKVNKYEMWHRAGNLLGEAQLKPEVKEVWNEFKSVYHEGDKTCGCVEDLYHNILLPNGEVSLCCMDYNLEEILGNLYEEEYDDILPPPNTTYDMCRRCENGVEPKYANIISEDLNIPEAFYVDSDAVCLVEDEKKIYRMDENNYMVPEAMVQYLKDYKAPEHEMIEWTLNKFADSDKVFVDVGAHVGTYTWTLAPHFRRTYAFEPTVETFNYLSANVLLKGLSRKVDIHNIALGNEDGLKTFFERSTDGGTNGFRLEYDGDAWVGNNQARYMKEIKRLDYFKITNIGLIKIDVEGYELEVLKGASQTLIDNDYPPILFESWPPHHKTNIKLQNDLFNYLDEIGYEVKTTEHPEIYLAIREK